MKSAENWMIEPFNEINVSPDMCQPFTVSDIKQVQQDAIQSCIAIVQHHNVNLMGGEAAKQSIIKALMTMVEK